NALKVVRVAIRPITGAAVSAKDVFRKVPIQITAHEQVEVTVVVIVEERGAGAPSARGYSRLCSSVGKRAVPVIDIENVLGEVSNVDIRIAVVVHIRHGDALTESAAGHSRLLRHIRERAIAIVPIQGIAYGRSWLVEGGWTAVDQVYIHQTVLIVVQECAAPAHGFDQVFLRSSEIVVRPRYLGSGGHISKHDGFQTVSRICCAQVRALRPRR